LKRYEALVLSSSKCSEDQPVYSWHFLVKQNWRWNPWTWKDCPPEKSWCTPCTDSCWRNIRYYTCALLRRDVWWSFSCGRVRSSPHDNRGRSVSFFSERIQVNVLSLLIVSILSISSLLMFKTLVIKSWIGIMRSSLRYDW
jgi:hypothetical protein